jgi:tetratricopeptide (TPR) repeat protein
MSNSKRLDQLLNMLKNSADAFLLFAVAKEYEKAKDNANALSYYLRLVNEQPDYVGTYYHLGKLYESAHEFDKAIETYDAGIKTAKAQGDQHSLSELAAAKMNLED